MPIQSTDGFRLREWLRALLVFGLAALLPGACEAQPSRADATGDLGALAETARKALLADRFNEAIGLYRKLALALPAEPRMRLNLAMALHSAGRYRESVGELERLRDSQSANPRFWFLLGVGYLKLDQPVKAVAPLEQAVRLDPAYTPSRVELAGALLESGSLERAEAAFLALSKDTPGLPKAWQGLAIARLELSREVSNQLDHLAPDSSFRYALSALAEAGQGNLEQARALYRKAALATPRAPWIELEMDALAGGNRHAPESGGDGDAAHPLQAAFALGQFERVLELSAGGRGKRDPEALYWRSRAYAELARIAVQRLSSLPPSPEQHELLALALQRAGRRSDAVAEWREASRVSPSDRRIRSELARSLRLNRQYDEAADLLQELVRLEPDRAEWQFELGDCLLGQGHPPEQALAHLSRAVELRPDALAYRALLGQVLLQSGNPRAAVVQLEQASPLDRDGSIHFQLANAYRSLGKPELARRALARQEELQQSVAGRPAESAPAAR